MNEAGPALRPHCAAALAKHPPRVGERVLDVGCGSFETTFDLARLVGRKGSVVSFDACVVGSEIACGKAPSNATVVRGDLYAQRFEPPFDRVFARLMTGCFDDPRPALERLRTALRPGGHLVVVCGAPLEHAASRCGQSPFASADPPILRSMVAKAGYVDVTLDFWCLTARCPP